jgi:hypothetical protein
MLVIRHRIWLKENDRDPVASPNGPERNAQYPAADYVCNKQNG